MTIFGTNEKLFTKDRDDLPVLGMDNSNFTDKFMKVADILSNKNLTAIVFRDNFVLGGSDNWQNLFYEGRSLFMAEVLGTLHKSIMKNMADDFGLLSFPKYDSNQTDYINTVLDSAVALGIPSSTENPERTGLILEAMAAESHSSVIPAYYDIALQYKLTRDEDSIKMLDIIRENRIYDLGGVYSFANVASDISNMLVKNDTNIASYREKVQDKVDTAIEKLVDSYKK